MFSGRTECLMLVLLLSNVASSAIIGKDDRKPFNSIADMNLLAAVSCEDAGTSFVSAIVGDMRKGLILTVAHGLVDESKRSTKAQQISTIIERCEARITDCKGNWIWTAKFKDFEIGDIFNPSTRESFAGDWATIELEKPIPDTFMMTEIHVVSTDEDLVGRRIRNVGLHAQTKKVGWGGTISVAIPKVGYGEVRLNTGSISLGYDSRLFLHDVDITGVASGSPIFDWDEERKKWVVMGMQVGDHKIGGKYEGYEYDEVRHYNSARKFTQDLLDSFNRLGNDN